MKILLVGDSHARPFWDKTRTKTELISWDIANARFSALGQFIINHKPDVIVLMGDVYDYKSLSSYDKGKRSAELERLEFDIEAAKDALERIEAPIASYNKIRALKKDRKYNPRKVFVLGNHEHRYLRLIDDQPLFADENYTKDRWHLQCDQAGFHKRGWEVIPFLTPINIEGFWIKHYWTTGIMGRPISGEYPAETMLKLVKASCVGAHSHLYGHATRANDAIGRIHGIVAGCFFGHHESYAGPANSMWWRGLIMLHDAEAGDADIELFSYKRVMRDFGPGNLTY